MKSGITRKSAFVLFCCLCFLFVMQKTQAEVNPPEFTIGQKLKVQGLNVPEDMVIIDIQKDDVTGDQVQDVVLLVGQSMKDNPSFYSLLNVVVQDGKSGKFTTLPERQIKEYLRGYEPKLFLGDFTGDKVKDVMVTVATGGSGGTYNHLIASWKNNKPVIIFGENENQGLKIKGNYLDGFKAELYSEVLNKTFIVDVSGYKKEYIEAKIYDANGKYIYANQYQGQNGSKYDIFSDPFSSLVPVDVDNDGVYELQGQQSVWGPFHAFTFTRVQSVWKYKDGKWKPTDAQYTLTYPIM